MLSTTPNTTIVHNCIIIIAAASAILLSISVSDVFNHPAKAVRQNRLDSYGCFISVVLVSKICKLPFC
ncbi:MAG: hypothetical protein MUD14_06375 [Hydrococcus sp. Prado102]|nr:hypothetical protein [Hydrococcus sp. Prado102]